MKTASEEKIQQEIFTWHWNNHPEERKRLFMVHNEASSRIRGARLKSQGMIPGVSDLIYLRPQKKGPIFIEVKTEKGKQQKSQVEWEAFIFEMGYLYIIVRSLEEFKEMHRWMSQ